jgi:hypothetical protein
MILILIIGRAVINTKKLHKHFKENRLIFPSGFAFYEFSDSRILPSKVSMNFPSAVLIT